MTLAGAQMLALHVPEGLGLEELERARAWLIRVAVELEPESQCGAVTAGPQRSEAASCSSSSSAS